MLFFFGKYFGPSKMSVVFYRGDPRRYIKYKENGDHHFYVDCTETKIVNGVTKICSYIHKREDKHKDNIAKHSLHECKFITKSTRNVIDNYFEKLNDAVKNIYSEEGVRNHLALLLGQKNISVDTGASEEMYSFITYCIAYGVYISKAGMEPIDQAKAAYRPFKNTTLSKDLIAVSNDVHKKMIAEYCKADFISIALDEGTTSKIQNLDFTLENPTLPLKPYPVTTKVMTDITANGYVQKILDGLSEIKLYGIKIGTIICDGNRAQKKAFAFEWPESLRNLALSQYKWIKEVIYLPCLCHLVDNSYKYKVNHEPELKALVNGLRKNAKILYQNRSIIGSKCPQFVSTRWIYDYEILEYIKHHHVEEIISIDEDYEALYESIFIFKSLVLIFENPNTFFWRAFFYLERAVRAFEQLEEGGNKFAASFKESLLGYTLKSEYSGLWVLGYLFTKEGHDDFYERINKNNLYFDGDGLSFFQKRSKKGKNDPLTNAIDEIVKENDQNASEEEEEDIEEDQKENDETDDHEAIDTELEDGSSERFVSFIDSARKTLKDLLTKNFCYSTKTTDVLIRQFNDYITAEDPFHDYQTNDNIGFQWKLIKIDLKEYSPIATIALILCNSGVSEASSERIISAQRLICNARRRHCKKMTLDARLRIMRAGMK